MITTDNQVKIMKRNLSKGKSPGISAASSGMDEKTARTYWDLGRLPSEMKASREKWWRTHLEPFFTGNPGLEAKTVFEHLQRKYSGEFEDSQLRTFQRRVKIWRASDGPSN